MVDLDDVGYWDGWDGGFEEGDGGDFTSVLLLEPADGGGVATGVAPYAGGDVDLVFQFNCECSPVRL